MLRANPDGLTWRFKKIVVRAFSDDSDTDTPAPVPAASIETEGVKAIAEALPAGAHRERVLDTFKRYCAGASMNKIREATGRGKGTISSDLRQVEELTGKHFIPDNSQNVKKAARNLTQVKRKNGQRAASVRDWHALRATWVTLALAAGVPVELVRRVTGHASVEIVLKHYFMPDREQFRAALVDALPDVLTGGKTTKLLNPADELATLANKIANGTATEADKARLRKLAAKV